VSRQRGGVYEDQPDLARQPGGIGCGIPVNHLCPAVAGGGGMTKDEALDLALEALDIVKIHFTQNRHVNDAITAIKQARSAPVQEPVAHCEAGPEHCQQCHLEDRSLALAAAVRYVKNNTPKLVSDEICMALASITAAQRPVTEPHKWVGLTDEEREGILDREFRQWWSRHDAVCRAIEAKLKEKNT